MSINASIDIKLVKYRQLGKSEYDIPVVEIFKILLSLGWNPNINGSMSFFPIGDDHDYDCTDRDFNYEYLLGIIEKKEKLKETIGISMRWKETDITVFFFFYTKDRLDGQILLSLDASRPILFELSEWHRVTDVNWFLMRLLPAFKETDFSIEYFNYSEYK